MKKLCQEHPRCGAVRIRKASLPPDKEKDRTPNRNAAFALCSELLDFVLDLGGLAHARAQVVQLGTADLTTTDHGDAVNTRAVDGERTLHTDAVRNAADSKSLTAGAVEAA